MQTLKKTLVRVLTAGAILSVTACSGMRPDTLGLHEGKLSPCPSKPNCVSSYSADEIHQITPYRYPVGNQSNAALIEQLKEALGSIPRTEVITATDTYLHAEATSFLMRYVDDIEFLVDGDAGLVHVRSASRIGYSDFGVNRERVEAIRKYLLEKQQISP